MTEPDPGISAGHEEGTAWDHLSSWWLKELDTDIAYRSDVDPLLLDMLQPQQSHRYLDLGCGEGRMMAAVAAAGAGVVGCDLSPDLLALAQSHGSVVMARLPELGWLRLGSLDGAYLCLVLEHLADHRRLFAEVARAVRLGGVLALVINHPYFTAPGSSPLEDVNDGEIMWRPGRYFAPGYSDEPAGKARVRFYHRSFGDLLSTAAEAGWSLERLVELPASSDQIAANPDLTGQETIPRLAGIRWRRL